MQKNRYYKFKFSPAFTLVEILVSMLILVIVVAGIMSSFISTQRLISRSTRRLQASYYARQILEELREGVNGQAWVNPAGTRLEPQPGVWKPCGINLGAFANLPFNGVCDYEVQAILNNCRQVNVRIRWQEP